MTKAEACLWKYVLKSGKMKGYSFSRQRPVLNYIADFFSKELKLVIEVDGYTHGFEKVMKKDEKKDKELNEAGYEVIRIYDHDVLNNITGVYEYIKMKVEEIEEERG